MTIIRTPSLLKPYDISPSQNKFQEWKLHSPLRIPDRQLSLHHIPWYIWYLDIDPTYGDIIRTSGLPVIDY